MNSYLEDIKGILGNVQRPKFKRKLKLKEVKVPSWKLPRPSRTFCIVAAILLEIVLIFVVLWIFDERTQFANDYMEKRTYGEYHRWGWFRKGVAIMLVLSLIGWFFAIVNEFAAYHERNRTFYKLYHKNRY